MSTDRFLSRMAGTGWLGLRRSRGPAGGGDGARWSSVVCIALPTLLIFAPATFAQDQKEGGQTAADEQPILVRPEQTEPIEPAEEAEARDREDAGGASQTPRDTPPDVPPEAIRILVAAATGDRPALRSNAIEAMQALPQRALPLIQRGLGDPNAGVRFAAVVSAGILDLRSLRSAIRPLLDDENPSVRAAARYALHTMGADVSLSPLAPMLSGRDAGLRGNVALLLGLLGDRSAVPMLKRAAATPMPRASAASSAVVRIQIAEAIARLGDDSALDALRAGAYSPFGEVRVLAINAMGAVGDHRMRVALEQMLRNPPVEQQLAAAGSLARLGSGAGFEVTMKYTDHQSPVVRSQAAWVLGWFDGETSIKTLRKMMQDPAEIVRVSAAAAMLRRTAGTPPR